MQKKLSFTFENLQMQSILHLISQSIILSNFTRDLINDLTFYESKTFLLQEKYNNLL
jgi:hypothetical protein